MSTNTTPQEHSASAQLTEAQERDAAFMSDPSNWPGIALPVVRKQDLTPNVGIVNAIMALDGRCEILIGNMWDSKVDWANVDRMLYPSFEACVLDGWRVN
jgi:hypothetical protein